MPGVQVVDTVLARNDSHATEEALDDARLDHLARELAAPATRRHAIGLVVGAFFGLSVAGAGSLAKGKRKKKLILCLNGETLEVSKKRKGAYLKQGATLGACSDGGNGGNGGGCPAGTKACNGACVAANGCCTSSECDPCLREICVDGQCARPGGMHRDGKNICSIILPCTSAGQHTGLTGICCSGVFTPVPPLQIFCVPGSNTCASDIDCKHEQHCIGNLCAPTYVATVGDQCAAKAFDICSERTQCTTGLCEDNLCKTCTSDEQCDQDRCLCRDGLCINVLGQVERFGDCSRCPAGTVLCNINGGFASCYPPCGKSL